MPNKTWGRYGANLCGERCGSRDIVLVLEDAADDHPHLMVPHAVWQDTASHLLGKYLESTNIILNLQYILTSHITRKLNKSV